MNACLKAGSRLVSIVALLVLVACGGGGGGDGSSDPFSVSPTSITFTAIQNGSTPATQFSTITVNSGTVYLGIEQTGSAFMATWEVTGSATGAITVTPVAPTMAPGTYTGTISVFGCSVADCSSGQVAGSPKTISVSYTIQPQTGLRAIPNSLSFGQVMNGSPPAAQSFELSDYSGVSYAWSASIIYQSGSGWLNINGSAAASDSSLPATINISINSVVPAGSYIALLRVTGNSGTLDIPVYYSVSEPQLSVGPGVFEFSGISHDTTPPANQSLILSTQGNLPLNYSASVIYEAGASNWLSTPASGSAPGTATVGIATTALDPGTYKATLKVSSVTQNSNVYVLYTLRAPTFSSPQKQLTFVGYQNSPTKPATQQLTISTENNINVPYTVSVSYGPEGSNWLTVSASGAGPGGLPININTTALNVGSYTATAVVTPAYGATPVSVGVTYQVSKPSLTANPNPLTYSLNSASVSGDLVKAISVGDTGYPMTWAATSSVPWVTVGTTSGATLGDGSTTSISISLVSSELEKIFDVVSSGQVTFNFTRQDLTTGTIQVPVTLNMNMPYVNYVAPYVALPNTSKEVIVRGVGFNDAAGQQLMFGNSAASSFTIVSDTEIRVTHPSFTDSVNPVTISNTLGLKRTRAKLVVVTPPTFSYTVIPTDGVRTRTIYDAERVAVYTNNLGPQVSIDPPGSPRIERHRLVAGSWVTDSLPIGVYDMIMTPDGAELVAITSNTLYHVDLNTWAITFTLPITSAAPYNNSSFVSLGMGNDGKALVFGGQLAPVYLYNVLTRSFSSTNNTYYSGGGMATSGDGSRIFFSQSSGGGNDHYYDVSTATMVQLGVDAIGGYMSYDRTGSMLMDSGVVYNKQFVQIGAVLGSTTISSDGLRGFAIRDGGTGYVVRTYDLTSPTGGTFTEIGTPINIPDSAGRVRMLGISNDDHALFFSGLSNFIVIPMP